jgi:hypothetical protein
VDVTEELGSIARHKLDLFLESELPPAEYPRILHSGGAAAQIVEVAMAQPITPRPMEHRMFVCAMSNPLHSRKAP